MPQKVDLLDYARNSNQGDELGRDVKALTVAYLARLCRLGESFPGIFHDSQVRVANARMREIYQQLAWPRLGHVKHFDLGGHFARRIVDASFVLFGKLNLGHGFGKST